MGKTFWERHFGKDILGETFFMVDIFERTFLVEDFIGKVMKKETFS